MVSTADGYTLRRVRLDEFDTVHRLTQTAFHSVSDPATRHDDDLSRFEPERSIGAYYGEELAGVAGAYTRDMTVPGGPIPVAFVTNVAVAAPHTRRGLLTRMMRHQLAELHEQGQEPVAALWASESAIYRRFGYGLASTHTRLALNTREVALVRPVPAGAPLRTGPATDEALRAELPPIYERVRTSALGHASRPGTWWGHRLFDPESGRSGKGPLRIAVHDGPDGPDGYVLYAVEANWSDDGPTGITHVRELIAESPEAEIALWGFLLRLDLVAHLAAEMCSLDSALPQLVNHPSRARLCLSDNLWVRVVDVGRALAARTYATSVDVVLGVTDEVCPWNTGAWRLKGGPDGASCARTSDDPDIALTSLELGAAYLGGTSLMALARTGGVTELRPGALRAAAVAFAEPQAPFCPEIF